MWIFVLLSLLLGDAEPPTPHTPPAEDMTVSAIRGEALAIRRCAACHATGAEGTSPNAEAPPLRELGRRYPVENLEEAFAEGILVAHDGPMPPFVFEADEVRDLVAYLRKLQDEQADRGSRR